MITRIGTWAFYAIVFFMLGVWSSSRLPTMSGLIDKGLAAVGLGTAAEHAPAAKQEPAAADHAQPLAPPKAMTEIDLAREAFGRGDIAGSIAAYRKILAAHPDDIDARGELGNVFYNAGQTDEAADTYYDMALRLIALGQPDAARDLIPVVARIQPTLAADIETLLLGNPAAHP